MSTDLIALGFSNLVAQSGSHIAYPFDDEYQRREDLISFVGAGLRCKEKCITAVCEYPSDLWLDDLQCRGINHRLLPYGQLQILTPSRIFGASGVRTPFKAIQGIIEMVEEALCEGWRSVRVCTSFNHLLHDEGHLRSILESLGCVNSKVEELPVTVLCTLDTGQLHPDLIDVCLRQHHLVTDGKSIVRNNKYSRIVNDPASDLKRLASVGVFDPPFVALDFVNDTPMICINGEMDSYTAPAANDLARVLMGMGHKRLMFDLSGTTFMDASAVSQMLRLASALEDIGGQLSICDPLDPPRKLFQLIQLSDRIPIYISYEEAEYAMRSAGSPY